jgi:hypothetical protein
MELNLINIIYFSLKYHMILCLFIAGSLFFSGPIIYFMERDKNGAKIGIKIIIFCLLFAGICALLLKLITGGDIWTV